MPVTAVGRIRNHLAVLILLMSILTACAAPAAGESAALNGSQQPEPPANEPTLSPGDAPPEPAASPEPAGKPAGDTGGKPEAAPAPVKPVLWVAPDLPQRFRESLHIPAGLETTAQWQAANLKIEIQPAEQAAGGQNGEPGGGRAESAWIYAVVAPFPTVLDEVGLEAVLAAWNGRPPAEFDRRPLLMSAETRAVLERYWGPPGSRGIQVVDPEALLDAAWSDPPSWAIIPFEEIQPRWKVLRVDGQSPLENRFDPGEYPLAIPIWLTADDDAWNASPSLPPMPTNRDPNRLTVLVMSGVTALSRHIGARMETEGVLYPARDIRPWLVEADLTHISNEVSFYTDCPTPGPQRTDMRFCSHPKYIELLEYIGADIIELTGNHNLDWGQQPYLDSLEMYRQRGWGYFGGGANLAEAQQPLLVEHNGNRLAFLGCSPAGPEKVWATDNKPGSAPCNFPRLEEQIQALRAEGILPVVTLQAVETDTYLPTPAQGMVNFRRLAAAGAVIVSGSQAHVPQTMTFVNDGFVHYGLGNLFFDQMEPPRARQQFIDRHIFYDGRYLGVELLTAILEDSARPRPMQTAERETFLETIFALCDWNEE